MTPDYKFCINNYALFIVRRTYSGSALFKTRASLLIPCNTAIISRSIGMILSGNELFDRINLLSLILNLQKYILTQKFLILKIKGSFA